VTRGTAGCHLVCGATVVDTLAPSYVQVTAAMAGSAAEIATEIKKNPNVETLGPINIAGQNFLSELDRSLVLATGDNRETCFLLQRPSINLWGAVAR